jgi:transposase
VLPADWFVGIDWAVDVHEVCVMDRDGHVVERRTVAHTPAGLRGLVDGLMDRTLRDVGRIVVGIEVPRGALVELCVERGLAVYAINPKKVDRFRDRFTVAGAKDDTRDAEVISDALRTDPQAFRRVHLDHPLVIQLREWSRVDDDLGAELVRRTNQLRDLVYRIAPGLLTVCPAADEPWFWALWRLAPTPADQQRLSLRRLDQLLKRYRIRRWTAPDVRRVLQQPPVHTAAGVVDAVSAHLGVVLSQVELISGQRREAARQLECLLDRLEQQEPAAGDQREHRDVAIVRSMPGIGTRVAAKMLAEASQPLADRAYHVVRTWAGVAPVTKRSGRRRRPVVIMRHACNQRLREAAYHWARAGAQQDLATKHYYAALRSRGHSHGRALRSVADRLLRILMVLLNRGVLFDPQQHLSAPSAVA